MSFYIFRIYYNFFSLLKDRINIELYKLFKHFLNIEIESYKYLILRIDALGKEIMFIFDSSN